jgi:hypothetical protein
MHSKTKKRSVRQGSSTTGMSPPLLFRLPDLAYFSIHGHNSTFRQNCPGYRCQLRHWASRSTFAGPRRRRRRDQFPGRQGRGEFVGRRKKNLGRRCLTIQADVSKGPEVQRLVSAVQSKLGSVSVLVNNAGIARLQPLEEITEVDWSEVTDVNLKSVFLMIQACLPDLRRQKGSHRQHIFRCRSGGGIVGPHYAASKSGLHGPIITPERWPKKGSPQIPSLRL